MKPIVKKLNTKKTPTTRTPEGEKLGKSISK